MGSAGVMLPHYSALKVAEQFRVLEAIAPGRIDLGRGSRTGIRRADRTCAQSSFAWRGGISAAGAGIAALGVGHRASRGASVSQYHGASEGQPAVRNYGYSEARTTAHSWPRILAFPTRTPISSPRARGRRGIESYIAGTIGPPSAIRARRRPSASGRWPPTPRARRGGCLRPENIGARASRRA